MKIVKEKDENVSYIAIEGEINIDTSSELRKVFNLCIQDKEKKIIIDGTNLSYIDSSGLATLIELFQRLKKIEGQLKLCGLSEKVKSVFEVTKLDKLFDICSCREKAKESLK